MESENYTKAFTIPCEAWYKTIIKDNPCINVVLCAEDGGVRGEFGFIWEQFGIQFMAFHDSWETLAEMPELVELMAGISRRGMNPTVKEFAGLLKDIGFKDITERR